MHSIADGLTGVTRLVPGAIAASSEADRHVLIVPAVAGVEARVVRLEVLLSSTSQMVPQGGPGAPVGVGKTMSSFAFLPSRGSTSNPGRLSFMTKLRGIDICLFKIQVQDVAHACLLVLH